MAAEPKKSNRPVQGSDLLLYLDERVRLEPSPSGLEGSLAFGVAKGEDQIWWRVDLGPAVKTSVVSVRPPGCDVYVGLDEAGALAILGRQSAAKGIQRVAGNRTLLAQFVTRYLPAEGAP
jgi:hypothetical protein